MKNVLSDQGTYYSKLNILQRYSKTCSFKKTWIILSLDPTHPPLP